MNLYIREMEECSNCMQVKLAEGGLGGPRKEDVHWLDWHQLKVNLLFLSNILPV
jgi:hypothetical protein